MTLEFPINPIPVNPDGSYDDPQWGELSPGPAVPAKEGTGYAGDPLPSSDMNYRGQHPARWIRAMFARMIQADQDLMSSWIHPDGGAWTIGGATLDSSITPTRVWIDGNDSGARLVEFGVPLGSPHTFTALSDTYVALNIDGAVEYLVVANGSLPPSPSMGYIGVWKVVTDAIEVTSAIELLGILPLFRQLNALEMSISGVTNLNDLNVGGNSMLGDDAGDSTTASGLITAQQGIDVTGGTSSLGPATTTTLEATGLATFSAGAAVAAGFFATFGTSAAPSLIGQLGRNANGHLLYHNGVSTQALATRAHGAFEAATVAAATDTSLVTSARITAPVLLYVVITVYVTRVAAGNVAFQIQEDDGGGTYSALGNAATFAVATTPTLVTFRRPRITDATPRFYRLSVNGGGSNITVREATIQAYPAT